MSEKHPTFTIQFTGPDGEVLPVEPSVIANILLPILGQISQQNDCAFDLQYGMETTPEHEAHFPKEEPA